MSDLLKDIGHCRVESCQCPAIHTILHPKDRDLGGFSVRRLLPAETMKSVGPFVFFDHLGPAKFLPGQGIDVRSHPHIGLATITYLFEGEILHRDSLGHVQAIRPGEINWMTAGRGIVHSERTPPALRSECHQVHALQLWVALPEEFEEVPPSFSHYDAEQLPTLNQKSISSRVMVGKAYGVESPVKTFSPTLFLEIDAQKGADITLPEEIEELGVYLMSGILQAEDQYLSPHSLAVFSCGANVTLSVTEDCRLVVIGGKSLGKRIVWWNLVATRKELIERAKTEWRAGLFPKVPEEAEFIPLPGD